MNIQTIEPGYLLSVRNLSKTYPSKTRALDNVSFDLASGECLGLLGASGSGKSTLGRCLLALEKADTGTVLWATDPIAVSRQAVFQHPDTSLNPYLPILDSLMEPLDCIKRPWHERKTYRRTRRDQAAELLSLVCLPETLLDHFPKQLSGGQKQRIAIARALSVKPDFLVLDEPTSSLDMQVQAQILQLLLDLRTQFSLTCLFISHDISVISNLSDRILIMDEGRIIDQCVPSELFNPDRHEQTHRLVAPFV